MRKKKLTPEQEEYRRLLFKEKTLKDKVEKAKHDCIYCKEEFEAASINKDLFMAAVMSKKLHFNTNKTQMLEKLLDIRAWETSPNMVNSHNAAEIFNECIIGRERIDNMLKDLEKPEYILSELREVLIRKRDELYLLQLDADETMNQQFFKINNY